MLPLLVILVSLLAASSQAGTLPERVFYAPEDAEYHFEAFIATFNKQYSNEEEQTFRFNVFKENLKIINENNAMGHAVFGINKFTDINREEFLQKRTGSKRDSNSDRMSQCWNVIVSGKPQVPDSIDWRDKGKVNEVLEQGRCGADYAFAIAGNLEGQYAITYSNLISISKQQLIECDDDNTGCWGGGEIVTTMTWLLNNSGVMTERDYPYTMEDGICKFDKQKSVLQVTSCYKYFVTEDQLKGILGDVGPLVIGIDYFDMYFYDGGILECAHNGTANYAVLLVGYGKEGDKPFWIVQNSMGKDFGERGYARLAMGKNSCNMMSDIFSAGIV